jgi:hypothetical protein
MNIIIYNFEDAQIEELSAFSNQVDSSVYFAFSLSEVTKLLKTKMMEVAILKILDKSEVSILKAIITGNPNTEFFVNNIENLKKEYYAEQRIHISTANTPLTKIAKQIKFN